jgi:hypothetical protein
VDRKGPGGKPPGLLFASTIAGTQTCHRKAFARLAVNLLKDFTDLTDSQLRSLIQASHFKHENDSVLEMA